MRTRSHASAWISGTKFSLVSTLALSLLASFPSPALSPSLPSVQTNISSVCGTKTCTRILCEESRSRT